jgi:hypothetical protein
VTFGFVDRAGCSVGLVWTQDSAPYRDWSSSGFGWTPSRPLPFVAHGAPPHASRSVEGTRRAPLPPSEPRFESAALHGKRQPWVARGSRLAPTRRIVGLIAHTLARVAERDT